jgi:hypothetical protein
MALDQAGFNEGAELGEVAGCVVTRFMQAAR